jgi:hypothetical protein
LLAERELLCLWVTDLSFDRERVSSHNEYVNYTWEYPSASGMAGRYHNNHEIEG